jgi:hypothetical protein
VHRKTLVGSNDAVGSVDRDASTLKLMMPLPTACMSVVVVNYYLGGDGMSPAKFASETMSQRTWRTDFHVSFTATCKSEIPSVGRMKSIHWGLPPHIYACLF